MLPLVGHNEIV